MTQQNQDKYLRVGGVASKMNVSTSTVWHYSRMGLIKPIKLSERVTVWRESDINTFIASRIEAMAV